MKKKLVYIFIDEGEFLYDEHSLKLYTVQAPHKLTGILDKDFNFIALNK